MTDLALSVSTKATPVATLGGAGPDAEDAKDNVRRATSYVAGQLLAWLVALAALLVPDAGTGSGVAAVVIIGWVLIFPGDALRTALRINVADVYLRLILAVSASLCLVMFSALLLSGLAYSLGGFAALDAGPMFASLSVLVAVSLAALAWARTHPRAALPNSAELTWWAGLCLLALLGWAGAKVLDNGGGAWLTILSLGGLSLLIVYAAAAPRAVRLRPALLFFFTLALSWSFSQRTDYLFGFDIHQEYAWAQRTLEAGNWQLVTQDPYAAMLSVTALPVALTKLAGIDLLDYFKTLAPLFFAGYVMGAFCFIRRFAGDRSAFVTTLLLVANPIAMWQLPAVSRQEVGLLLFAALMLLSVRTGARSRGAIALAVLVGAGLGVSHYTSCYIGIAILAGGALLGWAARWLYRPWRAGPRLIYPGVVIALIVSAAVWNVGLTQSSLNVGSAVTRSAEAPGLARDDGGVLDTWLNGGVVREVPAGEYFTATAADSRQRSWLLSYGEGLRQQFISEARDLELPVREGPLVALAPVVQPAYVVLRQVANLAMVAGVALLAFGLLRRRRIDQLDLLAMSAAALVVTMATRLNANLAQAYNAERLLLQTALVLGVGVALLGSFLLSRAQHLLSAHPSWTRGRQVRLARPLLVLLSLAVMFDLTGLRNLLIMNDAGHLVRDNEYYQRYGVTAADAAAADWLAMRYRSDDMVFADGYGVLDLRGEANMRQGVFGEVSPYTLDQRAYFFADSENVLGGRARSVRLDIRSTFVFPRTFLTTYKSRVYSNGSAEIYR